MNLRFPWNAGNFLTGWKPVSFSKRTVPHGVVSMSVKVKQSHYRPGQALRIPGVWDSQISRQSTHEGGKIVSPTHQPPLTPRKYSWYSVLLETELTPGQIVRPEGSCQWKIWMTPSGIELATFRLVVQCLNQLRHCMPPCICPWLPILLEDGYGQWAKPVGALDD